MPDRSPRPEQPWNFLVPHITCHQSEYLSSYFTNHNVYFFLIVSQCDTYISRASVSKCYCFLCVGLRWQKSKKMCYWKLQLGRLKPMMYTYVFFSVVLMMCNLAIRNYLFTNYLIICISSNHSFSRISLKLLCSCAAFAIHYCFSAVSVPFQFDSFTNF